MKNKELQLQIVHIQKNGKPIDNIAGKQVKIRKQVEVSNDKVV